MGSPKQVRRTNRQDCRPLAPSLFERAERGRPWKVARVPARFWQPGGRMNGFGGRVNDGLLGTGP